MPRLRRAVRAMCWLAREPTQPRLRAGALRGRREAPDAKSEIWSPCGSWPANPTLASAGTPCGADAGDAVLLTTGSRIGNAVSLRASCHPAIKPRAVRLLASKRTTPLEVRSASPATRGLRSVFQGSLSCRAVNKTNGRAILTARPFVGHQVGRGSSG